MKFLGMVLAGLVGSNFGPFEGCVPLWRVGIGFAGIIGGIAVLFICLNRGRTALGLCLGIALGESGAVVWLTGHYDCAVFLVRML